MRLLYPRAHPLSNQDTSASSWDPFLLCPFLLSSFPLICVSPASPFSINHMLLNPYFQLCFWETPPETRRKPCNPRGTMNRTLIISRIVGSRGGHRGRGDPSWQKGSETSPHAGASRVHLWGEACARAGGRRQPVGLGSPAELQGGGRAPRETGRGQNRGAWMPLNSLDFTAGKRHIQICLQKKNAFAAQSRRGAREAVPATFNLQVDKDREGHRVGAGGDSQRPSGQRADRPW